MHYNQLVKHQGAKLIFRLDEYRGNVMFDASGNGANAAIVGTPTLAQAYLCTDWPGATMLFGGAGNYGDLLADSYKGVGAYSASAIINLTSLSGPQTLMRVGDENFSLMMANGTGKLNVEYYDGTFHQVTDTGTSLTTATRYHIGVSRSSNGLTYKFYLNGALNSTVVAGTTPTAIANGQRLRIGADTGANQRLTGYMERLALAPGVTWTDAQFAAQFAAAFHIWPGSLPTTFDDQGYSETPIEGTDRVATITGPGLSAPSSDTALLMVSGNMLMTAAQLDTLQAFYNTTIEGGQDTFEGNLRNTGIERYYWLSDPPSGAMDAEGGVYETSFSIMALP